MLFRSSADFLDQVCLGPPVAERLAGVDLGETAGGPASADGEQVVSSRSWRAALRAWGSAEWRLEGTWVSE